jgi:hypothetical protein
MKLTGVNGMPYKYDQGVYQEGVNSLHIVARRAKSPEFRANASTAMKSFIDRFGEGTVLNVSIDYFDSGVGHTGTWVIQDGVVWDIWGGFGGGLRLDPNDYVRAFKNGEIRNESIRFNAIGRVEDGKLVPIEMGNPMGQETWHWPIEK